MDEVITALEESPGLVIGTVFLLVAIGWSNPYMRHKFKRGIAWASVAAVVVLVFYGVIQ